MKDEIIYTDTKKLEDRPYRKVRLDNPLIDTSSRFYKIVVLDQKPSPVKVLPLPKGFTKKFLLASTEERKKMLGEGI